MISVGIFTYARTGSNWLGHLLNTHDSIYYEEIFCSNYLEYFRKLIPIFNAYNIPRTLVDTFIKIYDPAHLKQYVDISGIQNYLDNKQIYSLNLLKTFKEETYKLNKNFIFKIFDEHCRQDITLEKLNTFTDYNIINYRQNALESYISYHKAYNTKQWTLGITQNKQDTEYSIHIDIKNFMIYKNNIVAFLRKAYTELNHPILISYENIHTYTTHQDKKQYVMNILNSHGLNIQLSQKEIFQKQNDNLLSHITNYSAIKNVLDNQAHIIMPQDIL